MPEPMAPATMPMPSMISITLVNGSRRRRRARRSRCSAGSPCTPAVQRLLITHSPTHAASAADEALQQALEHERDADEPVGRADELHHLDLASSGEHRRADRVPDQQHRGEQQGRPTGSPCTARRSSCSLRDHVDLVLGEHDLVHAREARSSAVDELAQQRRRRCRRSARPCTASGCCSSVEQVAASPGRRRAAARPRRSEHVGVAVRRTSRSNCGCVVERALDLGPLVGGGGRVDEDDHLDAALPLRRAGCRRRAGMSSVRPKTEQRDRRR